MNFNRETWYSKAIAVFLFFAFPIVAFYLGAKYQKSIVYKVKSTIASSRVPVKNKITLEKYYENNPNNTYCQILINRELEKVQKEFYNLLKNE